MTLRSLLHLDSHLPEPERAALAADGLVLELQDLRGKVTVRNFRSPRKTSSWASWSMAGSIGISRRRLVIYAQHHNTAVPSGKFIDIPLDHPLRGALHVYSERPGTVTFAFLAQAFGPTMSGGMECRLRTDQANAVVTTLRQAGFAPAPASPVGA